MRLSGTPKLLPEEEWKAGLFFGGPDRDRTVVGLVVGSRPRRDHDEFPEESVEDRPEMPL